MKHSIISAYLGQDNYDNGMNVYENSCYQSFYYTKPCTGFKSIVGVGSLWILVSLHHITVLHQSENEKTSACCLIWWNQSSHLAKIGIQCRVFPIFSRELRCWFCSGRWWLGGLKLFEGYFKLFYVFMLFFYPYPYNICVRKLYWLWKKGNTYCTSQKVYW